MPTTQARPPIAHDPAHAHVVAACQKLRQDEIENFFTRQTGSFGASLLMREVLYWFMPNSRQPNLPRTTVHRDERYWFCRTREEWQKKHSFTRRQLETAYKRCEDFLDVDHFMFAAQRRTHYSLNFERLRELLEQDEVLRDRLSSDADESAPPVGTEAYRPVGTEPAIPSVDSFREVRQTITHTERVPVVAPLIAPAAQSGPHLREVEQELAEVENPPETSNQAVHVLLKASEGKPLRVKLETVRPLSPRARLYVGYLMIWQRAFEQDHPGRKHHFNDQHVYAARDLGGSEGDVGAVPRHAGRGLGGPGRERGARPALHVPQPLPQVRVVLQALHPDRGGAWPAGDALIPDTLVCLS